MNKDEGRRQSAEEMGLSEVFHGEHISIILNMYFYFLLFTLLLSTFNCFHPIVPRGTLFINNERKKIFIIWEIS